MYVRLETVTEYSSTIVIKESGNFAPSMPTNECLLICPNILINQNSHCISKMFISAPKRKKVNVLSLPFYILRQFVYK
jgi:hypothetical protein